MDQPRAPVSLAARSDQSDQYHVMSFSEGPSLTGGQCGPPSTHKQSVSVALSRLRHGVLLCCWLVGTALLLQAVVWSAVVFTDLRWTEMTASADAPIIVKAEDLEQQSIRSALEPHDHTTTRNPVDVNRIHSKYDRMLNTASSLASGFGSIAVLAFTPLIGLGVLLAASSATAGVERAVSAFGWSLVVGLLVLPVGQLIGMPWQHGALWSYDALTSHLDTAGHTPPTDLVFYARYLLLPATCLAGVALVGTRFSAGVRAGLLVKEDLRLDPALEREAANVKPGSHHGGRAATAMRQTVTGRAEKPEPTGPAVSRTSAGEAPRRLI